MLLHVMVTTWLDAKYKHHHSLQWDSRNNRGVLFEDCWSESKATAALSNAGLMGCVGAGVLCCMGHSGHDIESSGRWTLCLLSVYVRSQPQAGRAHNSASDLDWVQDVVGGRL